MKACVFFMNMFKNQNPDDSLKFPIDKLGEDYRISRNFRLREAQSRCGSMLVYLHPSTLVLAQILRDRVGGLMVNSWYRSLEHNTKIQGSKESKHTLGMAVDLFPLECSLSKLIDEANKLDIGGMGIYENFVHLDTFGENRRWTQ